LASKHDTVTAALPNLYRMESRGGKTGRKKIEINWDVAAELAAAGCDGAEVADYIGTHRETFYRKCKEDLGVGWETFARRCYSSGNAQLKKRQFDKGMSGSVPMLIWLAQQRLGQYERSALAVNVQSDVNLSNLSLDELKRLQKNPNLEQLKIESKLESNSSQTVEDDSYENIVEQRSDF